MVRDLEKLRTRSEFRLGPRHLALIVVGAAVGAGALFAIGLSLAGGGDRDRPEPQADPLAALEAAAPQAEAPAAETVAPAPTVAAASAPTAASAIEPLRLSFHERFAAPAAATPAPHAPTAAPIDDAMAPLAADEPVVPVAAATAPEPSARHNIPTLVPTAPPVAPAGQEPAAPTVVTVVPAPATIAATAPRAESLPPGNPNPVFEEEPTPDLAQPGEHGIFTLQVASYPTQEEAIAFMNTLRQRGHETFLVRATDGDRGIIWRVRVGPFSTQRDAERYRRTFERTERIPTFVVRRQLPEQQQVSTAAIMPPT